MNFFGLLTIVLIALKLTDLISFSWWIVLSPTIVFVVAHVILLVIVNMRR